MTTNISDARIRFAAVRLVAFLAAVVTLGACSSASVPSSSIAATPPTNTPLATATATPSPAHAPTPLPTAAIVKITPIPGAADSGIVVMLAARGVAWSVGQIIAPAGKVWHVQIDMQDAVGSGGFGVARHNFTVASGPTLPERIYQSPNFRSGTYTYDIPALPAGKYLFICTIHANVMTGSLIIK